MYGKLALATLGLLALNPISNSDSSLIKSYVASVKKMIENLDKYGMFDDEDSSGKFRHEVSLFFEIDEYGASFRVSTEYENDGSSPLSFAEELAWLVWVLEDEKSQNKLDMIETREEDINSVKTMIKNKFDKETQSKIFTTAKGLFQIKKAFGDKAFFTDEQFGHKSSLSVDGSEGLPLDNFESYDDSELKDIILAYLKALKSVFGKEIFTDIEYDDLIEMIKAYGEYGAISPSYKVMSLSLKEYK